MKKKLDLVLLALLISLVLGGFVAGFGLVLVVGLADGWVHLFMHSLFIVVVVVVVVVVIVVVVVVVVVGVVVFVCCCVLLLLLLLLHQIVVCCWWCVS